jgi:hypothetical protein
MMSATSIDEKFAQGSSYQLKFDDEKTDHKQNSQVLKDIL